MTTEATDLTTLTDDQLVTAFWFSDALDVEDVRQLEAELERRGVDPWTYETKT